MFRKRRMMTNQEPLEKMAELLEIMRALRAPQGCPWDIEQTPESLAPYIIEEACELVDAIEAGEPSHICDELGDLLLQIVFQAQIFAERGQFVFSDVAQSIADKLVRRHPHVFVAENKLREKQELDQQWESIKRSESTHNKSCLADHLPSKLPSLQYTQKLISKARKSELCDILPDHRGSFCQLASDGNLPVDNDDLEEVIGRALYHITGLAYDAGIDAESALRKTARGILRQLDKNHSSEP